MVLISIVDKPQLVLVTMVGWGLRKLECCLNKDKKKCSAFKLFKDFKNINQILRN